MSRITIPVSVELLQTILRLPDSVRICGAGWTNGTYTIELAADADDAPDGAVTMTPTYQREYGLPDPVSIVGFQWWDEDGNTIAAEAPND